MDVRPWNLLAGAALLTAGCGGRTPSGEGESEATTSESSTSTSTSTESSTSASESSTGETTADMSETSGESPDCVEDEDCPPNYDCVDELCEYADPGYECDANSDCPLLELCVAQFCEPVASLSSCGRPVLEPSLPFELGIPEHLLAMRFVDADDDGREELVATSEPRIYTMSPEQTWTTDRGSESAELDAMAAGDLDGGSGEDVVLVDADTIWIHLADGLGGFLGPLEAASSIVGTRGLHVGDYSDSGPYDLLLYGDGGAALVSPSGEATVLTMDAVEVASARELVEDGGGFALRAATGLEFLAVDGSPLASAAVAEPGVVGPLIAIRLAGSWSTLSATTIESSEGTWTALEQWDPTTGERTAVWGGSGEVSMLERADLDGDGDDELALARGEHFWIVRHVGQPNACLEQRAFEIQTLGTPKLLTAGDYDGDGDDDLGLCFDDGWMFIIDAEAS